MSASFLPTTLGKTSLPFLATSLLVVAAAGALSACSSAPGDVSDVADGGDAAALNGGDAGNDAAAQPDAGPDAHGGDGATSPDGEGPVTDDASDASEDGGSPDAPSDDGGADATLGDASPPDGAPDAADAQPISSGPIDVTGGASCANVLDVTAAITSGAQYHITVPGVVAAHDPGWECNAAVPDGSKTYLSFNAPHAGNYAIRVTGGDESQWHNSAMYARRTCAQVDANTQLACNTQAGFNSTLVGVDSPQTVYLVADGAYFLGDPIAGTSGFDLTIVDYTSCQSNADCANFDGQPDCDVAGGDCFRPTVCPTGEASCDATQPNACNYNLTSDPSNCGACGTTCAAPSQGHAACVSSACAATCDAAGDIPCSNVCVNPTNDPNNCGACGTTCYSPSNGSSACVSSACVTTCNAGFLLCGGGCLDASEDPANCGACGNSCKGGGCAAGACTAPTPAAFGILSADFGSVAAVDDEAMYLDGILDAVSPSGAFQSAIIRFSLADGSSTQLVALGDTAYASALAVNSTSLVYNQVVQNTYSLWSVPKAGGTPTQLASLPSATNGSNAVPAIDETNAYWNGSVVPLAGGSLSTFTSDDVWLAAGIDATYVYWISGAHGDIRRMAKSATVDAPQIVTAALKLWSPIPAATTLHVTATDLFVQATDGVYRVPLSGAAPVLLQADKWNGSTFGSPVANATDAYFLLGPALWRAPLAGGPAVEIASGGAAFGGGSGFLGLSLVAPGLVWEDRAKAYVRSLP